jgi:NAD(P)-dependent dehydrogenase (short-subunit alcohol dehydrogenase family)
MLDTHLAQDQAQDPELTFRTTAARSFSTNAISPCVLTHALMPLLFSAPTRRIILISTGLSSHARHAQSNDHLAPPAGWPKAPHFELPAYRMSKAAANMMLAELRCELRHDGFTVHAVCPGSVRTGLGELGEEVFEQFGAGEARTSGRFVRRVIEGERDGDEGCLIDEQGVIPW